ncbi:MAG: MerR family transcriptional regulator [Thermoanaerobaculia bacterium]|jgi:DNA-binding transcriptional MerR regulator
MKFNRRVLQASFSTAEVARLTGLTARQLDWWDRRGFLSPSIAGAAGYGSKRRYSFADVVRLRLAARLRAAGIGLPQVRRVAETLRRLDPGAGSLGSARLLVADRRVVWARTDSELVDVLHGGQLMLVFPVGEEVADVARAAEDLGRTPKRGLLGGVRGRRP